MVAWHAAAACVVSVLVSVGLVAARITPVTILDSKLVSTTLRPGDALEIRREVRWHRSDCHEAFISAAVIDSYQFVHSTARLALGRPTTGQRTDREWTLPRSMPEGAARYDATLTLECAPFYGAWPIVVELPSLAFTVLPAAPTIVRP
jgi:hypothetical protein